MHATYTPATDDKLRQWAAEGVTVTEQARRLGVPANRVAGWRARLGLTSLAAAPVPPALHAKILDWVADGWPLREIAETAGLPLRQVRMQYPQASWSPAQQGSMGATVMRATRANPTVMRGL